jgi:hypothetical protein
VIICKKYSVIYKILFICVADELLGVGEEDLPDIIQTSNVTQHNCSEVQKIFLERICYTYQVEKILFRILFHV